MSNNYIFASSKSWCIEEYQKQFGSKKNWYLVTSKNELTQDYVNAINPKYIFFPHWSWLVPEQVTSNFECVCFHMADVPYGRGGSPLQNLIIRGHKSTKLSALRMVSELDAGPVYKKVDLSLVGSAREIFNRTSPKIMELVRHIVETEPVPIIQEGKVTLFQRRNIEQSVLTENMQLSQIYDHIRMLDADGYPKAFIMLGSQRLEFSDAIVGEDGTISASVKIFKPKE